MVVRLMPSDAGSEQDGTQEDEQELQSGDRHNDGGCGFVCEMECAEKTVIAREAEGEQDLRTERIR